MSVSLYYEGDKNSIESPNMGYRNARDVFEYLGVEFDYCGSVAVDELIERCSVALAVIGAGVAPSGSLETVTSIGTNGATFIDCGRSDDYMEMRINNILSYAKEAKASGASEITWG